MPESDPVPPHALTRRDFLGVLTALVPVLRWHVAPVVAPALALVQGPRGVWGVTSDTSPDTAAFASRARGIFGLQRGTTGGRRLERGPRGVVRIATIP